MYSTRGGHREYDMGWKRYSVLQGVSEVAGKPCERAFQLYTHGDEDACPSSFFKYAGPFNVAVHAAANA